MARYSAAEAAATIHHHMVNHWWHGYTQGADRWGTGRGETCSVESQGFTFEFGGGDFDCSSSVCKAWQLALSVTPYAGELDGATYTGNMRSVFRASGCFDVWDTYSTTAERGDVYLNDECHTAMCQSDDPDVLSEFLSNEFGGIVGGQLGDQTGWESVERGYYSFPWYCTLHYNGAADFDIEPPFRAVDTWTFRSNNCDAQKWHREDAGDGWFHLINEASGLALDVADGIDADCTPIRVCTFNGSDAQKWRYVTDVDASLYDPTGAAPIALAPKCAPDRRLDVCNGSTLECTGVWLYASNGTPAQQWTIVDQGDGVFCLVNNKSKLYLDVVNGGH